MDEDFVEAVVVNVASDRIVFDAAIVGALGADEALGLSVFVFPGKDIQQFALAGEEARPEGDAVGGIAFIRSFLHRL